MTKEQEKGGAAVDLSAFQPGRSGFFRVQWKRESIVFHYRKGPHDYTKRLTSDFQDDHVLSYCGGEKRGRSEGWKNKAKAEKGKTKLPSLTVRIKETDTVAKEIPKILWPVRSCSGFITSKPGMLRVGSRCWRPQQEGKEPPSAPGGLLHPRTFPSFPSFPGAHELLVA